MKIGFIGTGNMGSSIIKGVSISKFVESENINIFDLDKEKVRILVEKYGVNALSSEKELAENSDIIILAVKPHIIPNVLEKLKGNVKKNTIIFFSSHQHKRQQSLHFFFHLVRKTNC